MANHALSERITNPVSPAARSRFLLLLSDIRHQRSELHCPWQNGRIERLFGTLKQRLEQWQVAGYEAWSEWTIPDASRITLLSSWLRMLITPASGRDPQVRAWPDNPAKGIPMFRRASLIVWIALAVCCNARLDVDPPAQPG